MRKTTKIWLIVAASLLVVGLMMFASVMFAFGWNFRNLSTVKYETNSYEINDGFNNISINTDTADILFVSSDDGICRAVFYEQENEKHSVVVQDGTLTINVVNEKEWYDYFGIGIGIPKITLCLPEDEYDLLVINEDTGDIEIAKDFQFESIDITADTGDVKNYASTSKKLKIQTSTGDITVKNLTADTLDLTVSTGKTYVSDVKCNNLISSGNTGDISLKNVIASQNFKITRSTGDVEFDGCDANEVYIKTGTGDVEGDFLTDKVFMVDTDTGDVEVPRTSNGGRCKIMTSTGDIEIEISK